jgi:excisionase family DNA binding protein
MAIAGAYGPAEIEMTKMLCDIREAGDQLSVGRSKVYELLSEGLIDSVKIGERRLVIVESMRRFVASLPVLH